MLRNSGAADKLADQLNRAQEIAEHQRLAIPLTISTDPRNGVGEGSFGTSVSAGQFSKWPDQPGFGAIGDPALVKQFGSIAAQEYRAVGISMALSPQADLATEPRWPRAGETFGEEPGPVGELAAAYIRGFQGSQTGVTRTGVAAVVKHFAGYGAQANQGFDSHNYYGRFAELTQTEFERHVSAFRPAFRAGVAGVMPTYSILKVPGHPAVGGAFNRVLLQDVLRKKEGYRGIILSDWGVTNDCDETCINGRRPGEIPARITRGKPWGMENASRADRFVAAVKAGVDQIGDEEDAQPLVDAVRSGKRR